MAQYGVNRGLAGDYPADYDDDNAPYTPAWSEKYTGVDRDVLIRFAREWGTTAEHHAGQMHDPDRSRHQSLVSRQPDVSRRHSCPDVLRLCRRQRRWAGALCRPGETGTDGIVGVDRLGQGLVSARPSAEHAKLALCAFGSVALRKGFYRLPHGSTERRGQTSRPRGTRWTCRSGQCARAGCRSIRSFPRTPLKSSKQARAAGADHARRRSRPGSPTRLKNKEMKFSVEDPDAEANWPRVWFIWRGNAIMASAKGHEYFLRHYLGTHDNAVGEDLARGFRQGSRLARTCTAGKDGSGRRSQLPHGYVGPLLGHHSAGRHLVRKGGPEHTDMHSFIHPLSPAVPPCWESKSDWAIFKDVAKKFSECLQHVIFRSPSRIWSPRRWLTTRQPRFRSRT